MKAVAFYTLGCKMNFNETAVMEELFKNAGYKIVPFEEKADVYVINTCTVTHTADAKSRKAIRKAKHRNPKALVVATGCYSEVYPEELEKVKEADLITGNVEKYNLVELVEKRLKGEIPKTVVTGVWKERKFFPLNVSDFIGKTRAFVKIQQGCESFCSYCIIPKARGPMLSESPYLVIKQVKELVEKGFKEIVLTGTHLGAYRWQDWNLAKLLKELLKIENLYRIRLSSIEPMEFTDELISVITESPKIAPHFHIPLQSGSKTVLQRMNRRYTPEDYKKTVEKILTRLPHAAIGTDVMVGFPGETEKEFEETKKLIEEIPFAYLHVFPYSKRKGTKAALLKDSVPPEVKKERVKILREIGKGKSVEYRSSFLNKTLDALVLSETENEHSVALTDNYIRVVLDRKLPPSTPIKVKLTKVGEKREENYGIVIV